MLKLLDLLAFQAGEIKSGVVARKIFFLYKSSDSYMFCRVNLDYLCKCVNGMKRNIWNKNSLM